LRAFLFLFWAAAAEAAGDGSLPPELTDRTGHPIYLDFWASWCGPCAQSFPWLNLMRERYGDRLTIIGVNLDVRPADAARFLQQHPASFKIVYDPDGRLAERYHLQGMPSSVIVDAQGRVLHRHEGFRNRDRESYEAAIIQAIAGTAPQVRGP
jgi:cytochrome c biogenesis protein CcmG/thiol:disulfide interchange protein DsbE